jgi:hypothetical protein
VASQSAGTAVNTPAAACRRSVTPSSRSCKVTDKTANMDFRLGDLASLSPWKKITVRDFDYVKDQVNTTVTVAKPRNPSRSESTP